MPAGETSGQHPDMDRTHRQPILCGVDRSSESRTALVFAARLADRLDAPLVLCHVAPRQIAVAPPPLGGAALGQPLPGQTATADHALRDEAQAFLEDIAGALQDEPVLDVRAGDVASGIASAARDHLAMLVVVGARRRGAVPRAVLGSAWSQLAAGKGGPEPGRHGPRHLSERLDGAPLHVQTIRRPGRDAALELAHLADRENAALLVMGWRGRGPWRTAVLGSVSARLVDLAHRPVVIVADAGESPS